MIDTDFGINLRHVSPGGGAARYNASVKQARQPLADV